MGLTDLPCFSVQSSVAASGRRELCQFSTNCRQVQCPWGEQEIF